MRLLMVTIGLSLLGAQVAQVKSWDFDNLTEGSLPSGWKVEATGQEVATAKWQANQDPGAPLGPGVLELSATNHTEPGVFNLCWTKDISFREGEIAVFLRARSGNIDQGGGIIWRVQDSDNYYIARYNPLEKNVSIYYTLDGRRIMLGYSGKIELQDTWHVLKISHRGDRIRAFIDGEMSLMVNAGNHITRSGGVGLWTKADAATAFDNFTVIQE